MNSAPCPPRLALTRFSMRPPAHRIDQRRALEWLAEAHTESQSTVEAWSPHDRSLFAARIRKVIERCACGPTKIGSRGTVLPDFGMAEWSQMPVYDVTRHPRGQGMGARSRMFEELVGACVDAEYAHEQVPPADLVHVTCTGYVSPSCAQRVVQQKGWGAFTRVTHAYHMGCYAAFPATRIAMGYLSAHETPPPGTERRVDILHTEVCTLHLDPSNHSIEQIIVQSLFADGFIRYQLRESEREPGLQVLALAEQILPDSAASMSWAVSDWGMQMTLSWSVPDRIGAAVRGFVASLYRKAGIAPSQRVRPIYAIHPGGPKIIDRVREILELSDEQVQTSRDVLFDHGNMSSATLPHVWMRIVGDSRVPPGTLIVSLAFGPGLTVCGGLFRKQ